MAYKMNLIPIPKNSKGCVVKGWQNLNYDSTVNLNVIKKGNVGWVVPKTLMVLDIDTKQGKLGAESLAKLEAKYGKLPECPTQQTASGGFHKVFSLPDGVTVSNSAGKVAKDLDIKSGGNGYIVVEPSSIDGVPYKWISDSPNDCDDWQPPLAPQWLINLAAGEGNGIKQTKIIAQNAMHEAETQDLSRMRAVLARIPLENVDEYDAWLKVGLALSNWSSGRDYGLTLWDEWSRQSPKWIEGVCASKWRGFKPNETNGVTVSTLYFFAKSLPLNDEGLVARLTDLFSDKLKFCPGLGWLRFRG